MHVNVESFSAGERKVQHHKVTPCEQYLKKITVFRVKEIESPQGNEGGTALIRRPCL